MRFDDLNNDKEDKFMAALKPIEQSLKQEKNAFCCVGYYGSQIKRLEYAIPLTYDGRECKLEVVLAEGQSEIEYYVCFASVCSILYPKAQGKAEDMFLFFKRCWQTEKMLYKKNETPNFLFQSFKTNAIALLKDTKESKLTEGRYAFVEKVDAFCTQVKAEVQSFFTTQVKVNALEDLYARLEALDKDKEHFTRKRNDYESRRKETKVKISDKLSEIEAFIGNEDDPRLIDHHNTKKKMRLQ